MNSAFPDSIFPALLAESLGAEAGGLPSTMYSFRCSPAMNATLQRLTEELGLNRTSVIRLSLHLLDCYTRRQEVKEMTLVQLLQSISALAAENPQG